MVFMELGIETLLPACADAHKMVPSCSLAVGKMYFRQFVSGIQHPGSETAMQLLHRSCLPMPRHSAEWRHLFGDIHEASMSISYDSTTSQWPASCSTTRANSPQHEHKNRAVLFMRWRKASRNALNFYAISKLSHFSTVCVPFWQFFFF